MVYIINKGGKRPFKEFEIAIKKLKRPENVQELQAFLGKITYYQKFIAKLSEKASQLLKFLNQDATCKWTGECDNGFHELKSGNSIITKLSHYDQSKRIYY